MEKDLNNLSYFEVVETLTSQGISVMRIQPRKEAINDNQEFDGLTRYSNEWHDVCELLLAQGKHRLVHNMRNVSYYADLGLSMHVMILQRARELGGDLKLCEAQPQVRAVLEILEWDKWMFIGTTVEEAVEAFNQPTTPPAAQNQTTSAPAAGNMPPTPPATH